jgi:hypothetical protein
MNTLCSLVVISLLIMISCGESASRPDIAPGHAESIPEGPFMSIEPTDAPQILFPGFISTRLGEYNGTFNPEGTEFFYTISVLEYDVIVSCRLQADNTWSKPDFAPFSEPYKEWDPLFSPDGKRIYYSSNRPVEPGGSTDTWHIWYAERNEQNWGAPVHVPLEGPEPGNYFSSLTTSGNIYFNIWSTGDMYRGVVSDTGFVVESLGAIINSDSGDGDPFVSPDESYLIFRSYRPGGIGSGDFWFSFNINGQWTEPENPGKPINSKFNEMCPYVTTDGELFIFSSGRFEKGYYDDPPESLKDVETKLDTYDNGQQNIYTMSAGFIEEMRSKHIE